MVCELGAEGVGGRGCAGGELLADFVTAEVDLAFNPGEGKGSVRSK